MRLLVIVVKLEILLNIFRNNVEKKEILLEYFDELVIIVVKIY